jgi:hypothetical protein
VHGAVLIERGLSLSEVLRWWLALSVLAWRGQRPSMKRAQAGIALLIAMALPLPFLPQAQPVSAGRPQAQLPMVTPDPSPEPSPEATPVPPATGPVEAPVALYTGPRTGGTYYAPPRAPGCAAVPPPRLLLPTHRHPPRRHQPRDPRR